MRYLYVILASIILSAAGLSAGEQQPKGNIHPNVRLSFSERLRFVSWDNAIRLDETAGGGSTFTRHRTSVMGQWWPHQQLELALKLTNEFRYYFVPEDREHTFDEIFSKQVKAIGLEGDVLIGLSTSGNSPNVLSAVEVAKNRGIFTVGLTGNGGGKLADLADMALVVESNKTPRIQETHILAGHILCELVDYLLFQRGVTDEPV